MGATPELLANSSAVIHESEVAPLFGRIALDADGTVYDESWATFAVAVGGAIIEEWFS